MSEYPQPRWDDPRIDLEALLRPADAHGWRMTPTISIEEGRYVDDPSKFRDGEPGRVYGPAKVKLMIGPDRSKTLRVS